MDTNLHIANTNRVIGLDILRSISILIVLIVHFIFFYGQIYPVSHELISFCTVIGIYSVEIFFVLSGFLIGGILLRDAFPEPSWRKGYVFFMHRILRTLPTYYVVLIFLILFDICVTGKIDYRIEYFFFIQNYNNEAELFFPVSWTLPIEQWTYLLAPIVIFIFPKVLRKTNKKYSITGLTSQSSEILWSILFILLFFLVLRITFVFFLDPSWDSGVRKNIYIRLDAIFFGILIAFSKYFLKKIYKIMSTTPFFLCIISLVVFFSVDFYRSLLSDKFLDPSLFYKTIGFSVCDILFALTIPFFSSNVMMNALDWHTKKVQKIFYYTSIYSYPLYLVHHTVFELTTRILIQLNIQNFVLKVIVHLFSMGTGLFVTFALTVILHKYIEKPGMNLRRFI